MGALLQGLGPLLLAAACGCGVLLPQLSRAQADDEDTARADARADRALDEATQDKAEADKAPVFDTGVTTLEAGANAAYRLEVRAPNPLRTLLVRHLDLARFREQADISVVEVGRLIAAAPDQTRSLLEPEGYFNARVEVKRDDDPAGGPPTVRLRVDPGTPARVGRVQLEIQGPFGDAMNAGDKELNTRWQRLTARWPLKTGAPFSQSAWTAAKNTLLANLRTRGYANASLSGTGAEVDAPNNRVRLFVVVDSGPLYRIGEVRVEGLERTPQEAALNVLPFEIGSTYTEKKLLDYQEALQKSGLYEGVAVELDQSPEGADHAIVYAKLRENKVQNATLSVGYSSNTGPRVGIEHTHRRVFGHDLVATTKLKIGRDERTASFDLLTYPQPGGYRNLLGLSADYLDAGGALTQTQRVRVGRTRDSERVDRLYYLEYNRTTLETATARSTDRALLANYEWVHRDVNNLVFPTRGLILSAQGGAGVAYDSDNDRGPFSRLYLQAVWYQQLPGGWLGQLRGEVGQVLKKDSLGIPDSLLFRAGGDDSVRGYGYRTLGPVRDGAVVGGPVLATGSLELAHRLSNSSPNWRNWYGAVFVDAGNAAQTWDDYDPAIGYGVGVRWRSPIGPLRIDLAYGQQVKAARLHISVGVTF
ncbi:autotransporter assembly complex protein TamA [Methylibium sp.]|uniref:autotransporter assembly complex protein TamA n=1 Tax=Methylibium sp. TaxID=2067992 RepID=UPI003D0EDE7F